MRVKFEEITAQKHVSSGKRACLDPLSDSEILGGFEVSDGLQLSNGLN